MRHLFLVSLILLASCGFHLRGSVALPPALSVMAVEGATTEIAPDLRHALKNAGVRVTDSASMVLKVWAEQYAKRVLSVDSAGRALEYDLSYSVHFSLIEKGIDGNGERAWISDTTVTQARDIRFDATAVLGFSSEEEQLNKEMRRDAVAQILRQLRYAKQPVDQPESK